MKLLSNFFEFIVICVHFCCVKAAMMYFSSFTNGSSHTAKFCMQLVIVMPIPSLINRTILSCNKKGSGLQDCLQLLSVLKMSGKLMKVLQLLSVLKIFGKFMKVATYSL